MDDQTPEGNWTYHFLKNMYKFLPTTYVKKYKRKKEKERKEKNKI